MNGQGEAAGRPVSTRLRQSWGVVDPVGPSVREVLYARWLHPTESPADYSVEMAEALGIDPDMPFETLRRRLVFGLRVERLFRLDNEVVSGACAVENALNLGVHLARPIPDITDHPVTA